MKLTSPLFALCLLVPCASIASAQPVTSESRVKDPSAADRLDFALFELKDRTFSGEVSAQDFETVQIVLEEWINAGPTPFDPEGLQKKLQEVIANLTTQAGSAYHAQVEIARLHESIVEAKLDRMLFQLEFRMKEGGGTQQMFERLEKVLNQRANSMIDSPSAEQMRQRLQAAIAQVHERARAAADGRADTDDLHRAIFAARAQRTLERLELQISKGEVSPSKYVEWVLKTSAAAAELEERLKSN